MKKIFSILVCASLMVLISGCVTKQKYNELQSQYQKCQDDLTFANSENVDFANAKKELSAQVESLSAQTEQLKKDTLTLSRRLHQSERDLAKTTKDYDDLLNDFGQLNMKNQTQMNSMISNLDSVKDVLAAKEKLLNEQQDSLTAAQKVLADAQKALADKEARIQEMQDILNQKDAEVKSLKDKVSQALKGFENSGLNVFEKDNKVYVSMDDKLMFASGSWTINEQGLNAIKNLAQVLENETEISVLIEGHTDNVPYRGNGQVKDNWDLSVMRATAVVKALLQNGNINPVRLSASGRSEFLPIDPEDSADARAKNRRTEIILTPNLDKLMQLIQGN